MAPNGRAGEIDVGSMVPFTNPDCLASGAALGPPRTVIEDAAPTPFRECRIMKGNNVGGK